MPSSQNVLALLGKTVCERRPGLEGALTSSWTIEEWIPGDEPEALANLMARASAMITGGDALMSGAVFRNLDKAAALRFWQIPFTGYEWLDFATVPPGCVVANAYGHEIAMAEFVLGGMLEFEKNFRVLDSTLRANNWQHRGVAVSDFLQGELYSKTVGFVGYGAIARESAKRATAFGMDCIAVSRSERETPAPLSWYGTMDKLPELLSRSDYVVLTCELNDETRGLIGAKELTALGPKGVLVNVARAHVADEDALFEALKTGGIRGAVLDVWYNYPGATPPNPVEGPPPSKHDFASLENVVMTPHCAANTLQSDLRRYVNMAKNLDLVAAGKRPASYIGEGHTA